jgi:hypothetical protein
VILNDFTDLLQSICHVLNCKAISKKDLLDKLLIYTGSRINKADELNSLVNILLNHPIGEKIEAVQELSSEHACFKLLFTFLTLSEKDSKHILVGKSFRNITRDTNVICVEDFRKCKLTDREISNLASITILDKVSFSDIEQASQFDVSKVLFRNFGIDKEMWSDQKILFEYGTIRLIHNV